MKIKIIWLVGICIFIGVGCEGWHKRDMASRVIEQNMLSRLNEEYGCRFGSLKEFVKSPECPGFLQGVRFERNMLVFQVVGDTLQAREELELLVGNCHFGVQSVSGKNLSVQELAELTIALRQHLENLKDSSLLVNLKGYYTFSGCLHVLLEINTPEYRQEFRKKIVDSPVLRFDGQRMDVPCLSIGTSDSLGIRLEVETSCYPTRTQNVRFILRNGSKDRDVWLGETHYPLAYAQKGKWYVLPSPTGIDTADPFIILEPGDSTVLLGNLHPELHPNRPGCYRFFQEVVISGRRAGRILLMAEFRLED